MTESSAGSACLASSKLYQGSTNAIPPKTFTPFPRLALELRLAVWGLAVTERLERDRIVLLYRSGSDRTFPLSRLSAVFHVNRESRAEAIKALNYEPLLFSTTTGLNQQTQTLFNFQRDILYLNNSIFCPEIPSYEDPMDRRYGIDDFTMNLSALIASLAQEELERIQCLAMDLYVWCQFDEPDDFARVLQQFTGLRVLTVVMQEGKQRHLENIKDMISNREFIELSWGWRKERRYLEWKLADIFYERSQRSTTTWDPPDVRVVFWK